MQDPSSYTEAFEREHGCTLAEWLEWLPGAMGDHAWHRSGDQGVQVKLGPGTLHLDWQVLPPRQIALIRMPRLLARYRFEAVAADERVRFMQRFDLYMQRGGG